MDSPTPRSGVTPKTSALSSCLELDSSKKRWAYYEEGLSQRSISRASSRPNQIRSASSGSTSGAWARTARSFSRLPRSDRVLR